jgi:AraC-like DNA-binding protein
MTITFQDNELRQVLEAHSQRTQPELLVQAQDRTLAYPDWLGRGYKRDIELPRDIQLTLHQYRLSQDLLQVISAGQSDCLEFVFNLKARSQFSRGRVLGNRQVYLLGPQQRAERWQEFAEQDYLAVDIHIDPELLLSLVTNNGSTLPKCLEQLLAGQYDRPFLDPVDVTPAMQTALWQILQCPYQGLTRSLYLEAKSIELIALYLESTQTQSLSKSPISRDDRDRIHFAREILLQRLADPPSLVELARLVGLNDYKLKAGFRQVFGTTVFGYLRQERLEKARQLLQAQDISVTAAAAAVGYSSQGHFAAAFRKQFGINPKDLRAGRQI